MLLDITNRAAGWLDCHIVEHHEGGLMVSFDGDP